MKRIKIVFMLILAVALGGCAAKTSATPPPAQSDSFFSTQAWLDENANGQLDAADTPIENATLIVRLEGGTEFGSKSNAEGHAFVSVPGGAQYPVSLTMQAPAESDLILREPVRVRLDSASGETISFLFSKK